MTLVATQADAIPDGAVCEWLEAPDATKVRMARFSRSSSTRGTVVLLNGRTEYIEKYFEAVDDLLSRGFAVASLDWRGQGLSDRPLSNRHKGHVADFALYTGDLERIIESFVLPACPAPLVVLSHSMGGNIALRYLASHPGVFQAACFSAPMWGIGKSERPGSGAQLALKLSCALGMSTRYVPFAEGDFGDKSTEFEGNSLTSDGQRFARFMAQIAAEPRLALGSPTIGWARQAFASMDVLHAPGFAEAIETPIRVCTAGADTLVSAAAHTAVLNRLPNAKGMVFDGARHELLVEVDRHRDRILGVFDELMDELGI